MLTVAVSLGIGACSAASPRHTRANFPIEPNAVTGPASSKYDTPPRLLSGKTPIYPISQLLNRKEGHTIIEFTIGEDGKTKDFAVFEADYEYYANHAIIAAREWRFAPATKDGHPIEVRVRQRFNYAMQ